MNKLYYCVERDEILIGHPSFGFAEPNPFDFFTTVHFIKDVLVIKMGHNPMMQYRYELIGEFD